ncbi:MAG TPA: 5'-3' exonuclease H3TH domain-containing protein [Beutenbergiaceae bacterium]|nr:5'-3' exonuclease H3TH domain-containing protein [Beutenbergiaceae bacterium]
MNGEPKPVLVLVDGFNLLWRAAFGFPTRVTTRDGRDVTAPFGFFALLRKALHRLGRRYECIVVFDSETGWNGRRVYVPDYKEHRVTADFSPIDWLPEIQEALNALGLAWQESGDWEADDVIASIAGLTQPREVLVMSTDRDFYQLLDQRVSQLNTARAAPQTVITEREIRGRFGVAPRQWCDYIALVGDPSDGIAGIRGIGPVRAAALLDGNLTLDDLPGSGRLVGAHGRCLRDNVEQAIAWRELIRFRSNLRPEVEPSGQHGPELPLAAEVLAQRGIW